MKKFINYLVLASALIFISSCADPDLDPLQFDKVKKGTILALRGQQLTNIYFNGLPGAEFFPRIINGSEVFTFEAEILAEDPAVVQEVKVYAIERQPITGGVNLIRHEVATVPFSAFGDNGYRNPSTTISINLTTILNELGLDYTDAADVATILDLYRFGIQIDSDIILTNGDIVSADDIVAAGLFQSNQFYPAQKLVYTVTDYCTYDASLWAGNYNATEVYSNGAYGPYVITLTAGPGVNQFTFNNFWDSGVTAFMEFTPSTSPDNQVVLFPDQVDALDRAIESTEGTYDQCKLQFNIQTQYRGEDFRYEFRRVN